MTSSAPASSASDPAIEPAYKRTRLFAYAAVAIAYVITALSGSMVMRSPSSAGWQQLLQGTSLYFALAFCVIVGVLLLVLWGQRRQRADGCLGLMALLWSASALPALFDAVPITVARASPWISLFLLTSMVALARLFSEAMADATEATDRRQARRRELAATAIVLLVMLITTLGRGDGDGGGIISALRAATLVLLALSQVSFVQRVLRGSTEPWVLLPTLVLMLLALSDAALEILRSSPGDGVLHFAMPLYVGMFAWFLLSRFIDEVQTTSALNVELDRLVREKTSELEAQYARVRAMERERLLIGERERIMRDMHDGVGGQLVSAMAMLENGREDPARMQQALSAALTDMRLMIDSLDDVDEDLNIVLGVFRDRLEPQLTASQLELHWHVDDLPSVSDLSPATVLAILRILQEAVTNTVKHADASRVSVEAGRLEDTGVVRISVADDGRGFDAEQSTSRGRGLRNLHRRAADHGFALEVTSQPGRGTRVTIMLGADRIPAADG